MGFNKQNGVPIFQGRGPFVFHPYVALPPPPQRKTAPLEDRWDASHGPHPRRQQLQRHPIEPSTDGRGDPPTHWKQVEKTILVHIGFRV